MEFGQTGVLPPPTEDISQSCSENRAPSPVSAAEIVLPTEHPLCKLYSLWRDDSGQDLPLCFSLFAAGDPFCPTSPQALAEETSAAEQALTEFASGHWSQLLAKASDNSAPSLDEQVFIHLSQDEMTAWLLLLPPIGSEKRLSLLQLLQALAASKVSYGVDLPLLKQISHLPRQYFQLFPIAHGTAPLPGEDGKIVDLHPWKADAPSPVRELGQADYLTLNLVRNIKKGEQICEIIPPVRGTPGHTVTGALIAAPAGEAPPVPQGRNTTLSEDGRYLLAAQDGHLEYNGRKFQVKPVLEIPGSVDRTTGDINFLGDVHVHGDVCCGVTVRAMGNIQVDGVIESCTIEAGENLVVSSGIQGQDCAVIRAHKSIYAKYLDHCYAYARENIQADCIIDCNIFCNGLVKVLTGRGAIVGGTIRSSSEVSATTVGSKAERLTSIVLGGLPYEDFERIQMLRELEQAEHKLAKCEAHPDTPEHQSKLSKLRLDVYVIKMKLAKFDKDLHLPVPPRPEEDFRRLVCGAAYPGTTVTIDHITFRVTQMTQNCVIGLQDGLVGFI